MLISSKLGGFDQRLLNILSAVNNAANLSRLRLATGQRINASRDNPSDFVTLNLLERDLSVVNATLRNINSASSQVSQVQTTTAQIRTQLNTIRDLAAADLDGGLTDEQRAANQAAIDLAIRQINKLAGQEINGRRLLEGRMVLQIDYEVTGVNAAQIAEFQVETIEPDITQNISGTVTATSQTAQLTYQGKDGSRVRDDATFDLTGDLGTARISVSKNEPLVAVRNRINAETANTGVTASVQGDNLILKSVDVGSDAQVSVDVLSGKFDVSGGNGNGTANGTDATAVINGQGLVGEANRFTFSDATGSYEIEFVQGFTGNFDTVQVTSTAEVSVSKTDLAFALSSDVHDRSTLAVSPVNAQSLGGVNGTLDQLRTGGAKAGLGTNAADAVQIVDEALDYLTRAETEVSVFANITIDSAQSMMTAMKQSLEESIASINTVDEAEESALLARNLILAENAQFALKILYDQRMSLVDLLTQRIEI